MRAECYQVVVAVHGTGDQFTSATPTELDASFDGTQHDALEGLFTF
jgi:hypothetical protein